MSTPKSISAARRSRELYQAALRNPRGSKEVELTGPEVVVQLGSPHTAPCCTSAEQQDFLPLRPSNKTSNVRMT